MEMNILESSHLLANLSQILPLPEEIEVEIWQENK